MRYSEEEKHKILHKRALELARETRGEEDKDLIQVLKFLLANETYGIHTDYIEEVYPLKDLTSLPCTPDFVLGIINLRGRIVSIIDMRSFFDLPFNGLTDLNKVIIVQKDELEFGILADKVLETEKILKEKIQPLPPTFTGIREEYSLGVTGEGLIILNSEKLLTSEKIIVNDEV